MQFNGKKTTDSMSKNTPFDKPLIFKASSYAVARAYHILMAQTVSP